MATPITWRNVRAPNFAGSSATLRNAADTLNTGLSGLTNIARQQQSQVDTERSQQEQDNLLRFNQQLQNATPEQVAKMQQQFDPTQARSMFGDQTAAAAGILNQRDDQMLKEQKAQLQLESAQVSNQAKQFGLEQAKQEVDENTLKKTYKSTLNQVGTDIADQYARGEISEQQARALFDQKAKADPDSFNQFDSVYKTEMNDLTEMLASAASLTGPQTNMIESARGTIVPIAERAKERINAQFEPEIAQAETQANLFREITASPNMDRKEALRAGLVTAAETQGRDEDDVAELFDDEDFQAAEEALIDHVADKYKGENIPSDIYRRAIQNVGIKDTFGWEGESLDSGEIIKEFDQMFSEYKAAEKSIDTLQSLKNRRAEQLADIDGKVGQVNKQMYGKLRRHNQANASRSPEEMEYFSGSLYDPSELAKMFGEDAMSNSELDELRRQNQTLQRNLSETERALENLRTTGRQGTRQTPAEDTGGGSARSMMFSR